jgi:hypothetical protein
MTPGGLSFQDPFRLAAYFGAYPPLWASTAPSPLARSYGAATKRPGDANLSRRDRAAWAAGAGCTSGTPHFAFPGHRSPPRAFDAAAPLGWDGMLHDLKGQCGKNKDFIPDI